jgi:hypothetical protein
MKISKNNFSIFNLLGIAALSATLMISSCKDDDHVNQQASLKAINGVPGSAQYLVKLNGTELSDTALAFRKSLAYRPVIAGPAELVVTDQSTGNVVSSSMINLAPNTTNSVYVAQDAAAASKVSVFTIKDDFSAPAAGKARVRFVNVNSVTGPLDLTINGQPAPLFTGITFKGSTAFVDIDPGTVSFTITETGKTEPVFTLSNVVVAQGTFKTLWATNPVETSETTRASLGVISNK